MPSVFVIIINWNDYDTTKRCIDSVKASNYSNLKIAVIDNGSKDNSPEKLSKIDGIKLLANSTNLGFTGACNQGFKIAIDQKEDLIWLVNNDVEVEQTTLSTLVSEYIQHPSTGCLSPVIVDNTEEKKIQHACSKYSRLHPSIEETSEIKIAETWQQDTPEQILVWGTAMLVSRKVITHIGEFDDRLFAYLEDFDLCLRAIESGYHNRFTAKAIVYHQAHPSNRPPHYYYYTTRNGILFWKRHHRSKKQLFQSIYWLLDRIKAFKHGSQLGSEQYKALTLGFCHGLSGKTGRFESHMKPTMIQRFIVKVLLLI